MGDKAAERRWVLWAQELWSGFPRGEPQDSEAPDFVLVDQGVAIGLEVTEYFQDDNTQEIAVFRDRVAEAAEERLRQLLSGGGWQVGLHWGTAVVKGSGGWRALADAIAADVSSAAKRRASTVRFEVAWDHLSPVVREHLAEITIDRIGNGPVSCVSHEAGMLDTTVARVQSVIDRKSSKFVSYRQRVSDVDLLIVAASRHLSSMITSFRNLRDHEFVGPFRRVYLLDVFSRRALELRINRAGVLLTENSAL